MAVNGDTECCEVNNGPEDREGEPAFSDALENGPSATRRLPG